MIQESVNSTLKSSRKNVLEIRTRVVVEVAMMKEVGVHGVHMERVLTC
jgi:ribosomal protein L6P/L9E